MPNQRAEGKRLIGAQATPELWEGVEKWLQANPRLSVTDFVLTACLEKLQHSGIPIKELDVFRDGRRAPINPSSSESTSHAKRLLKKAVASVHKPGPK